MKLVIGSDHGGFELKEKIKKKFKTRYKFNDIGTFTNDSVDYPDIAKIFAKKITSRNKGLLICGTGIGISIAANRHKHIRAALCYNEITAKLARQHNNANVMCLGGRYIDINLVAKMISIFTLTSFEGGRHKRRVNKL